MAAEETAEILLEKEQETKEGKAADEGQFTLDNVVACFSKLFTVDPTQQLDELEAVVDGLLVYSGECCSMTDQIREESKKLLFGSMPEFYEKRMAMQKLFKEIDALEEFVSTMKANVDEMEESVQIAEKQLGHKNLKKIISSIPVPSFFAQKKQAQSYEKTDEKDIAPQIPTVFKVDDYINSEENYSEDAVDTSWNS